MDCAGDDAGACPPESEILAVARGDLDLARAEAVRTHVDACSDCQTVLACMMDTAVPVKGNGAVARGRALAAGEVVGRYEVVGTLGMGAMGIVYAATDRELRRKVALKMLRAKDALATDRLVREAQALARVSHPNVIVVYEVGRFDDQIFMAMEYVDGDALAGWLAGSHGVAAVVAAFRDAGRGLAAAHRAGLVHRDFKPDNVLLGRDGRVRVADFGLARSDVRLASEAAPSAGAPRGRSDADPPPSLRSLTRTGAILGTPAYMAPEQHDGHLADARSDQFAFAVSLYEALHGTRPFPGATLGELAEHVRRGEIPSRTPRRGRVEPHVLSALRRGLQVRPDDRFPTMDAMLDALEKPRRRVAPFFAVATAIVAVMSIAWFSMEPAQPAGSSLVPAPALSSGAPFAEGAPSSFATATATAMATPAPRGSVTPEIGATPPTRLISAAAASARSASASEESGTPTRDPLDRRR